MTSWGDVSRDEPEFAARVQKRFDAYKHKVMASLRPDGAPRISGIEAAFRDGEILLGMMPGSVKARDVLRDARLALHSGTEDPPESPDSMAGMLIDAKISGRAVEETDLEVRRAIFGPDDAGPSDSAAHLFKIDIDEVVLISLGDPADHLLIETWRAGKGLRSVKR